MLKKPLKMTCKLLQEKKAIVFCRIHLSWTVLITLNLNSNFHPLPACHLVYLKNPVL
jgi:hypothetical protein